MSLFVVPLVAALAIAVLQRRFEPRERPWLWVGLLAHLAASVAMVIVTVRLFRGGDMVGYWLRYGAPLAEWMHADFSRFGPVALDLVLQRSDAQSWSAYGGTATGTMHGVAAWLHFLLGPSLTGACLAIGSAGYLSKLAMYRVLSRRLPKRVWRYVFAAVALFPSTVFWTCGLLKEPLAMIGLGPVLWATSAWVERRGGVRHLLVGGLGVWIISLTKPYLLLPYGLASAAWLYVERNPGRRIRPTRLILAAALGFAFILAVGQLRPRYALENLAEEAADLQEVGTRVTGGSSYTLSDAPSRSLPRQVAMAPIAVVTALFRPFVFEAHNAVSAVNGVEMLFVTWLFIRVVRRRRLLGVVAVARRVPVLTFCIVFTLGMALGVGLATTNLGTLSRYRVPLMPFFLVGLAALGAPSRSRREAPATAPSSTRETLTPVAS